MCYVSGSQKTKQTKNFFSFFLSVYSFKTSVHIHMKMTKNIPLLIFNSDNEFYVSSFFYLVYICSLCSLWWSDAGYVKYLAGLKTVGIFIYALSFLNFVQFFSVKTQRREFFFLFSSNKQGRHYHTSASKLMFWSAQKSLVMGIQLKYLQTSQSWIGVT